MIQGSRIEWLVVAAFLVAAHAVAQTVSLELKNGDRVTGRVLSETNNRVLLSNAWSAAISIPLNEVTKRIPLAVPTNVMAAAGSTNVPPKTNAVTLAKAVASTNTLFSAPWMKNWHGDIQAGVELSFSERNRQIYN